MVPNIKDADNMSMIELAQAIEQLAATARDGKTTPEDMKDGTITMPWVRFARSRGLSRMRL
jgi:pyruvate dehydrogenase E2 component (dihydrolipoamide acetyltransferase)